jgi:threonine dehydratase
MVLNRIPTREDILQASERIQSYIHKTPVLTSSGINEITGSSIFFKCENFQKVGAFKARGAMNAVLSLSEDDRKKGVATHSSGNHAQAVARAAKILGINSYIVMPTTAAAIKTKGVLGYGGKIFTCEPTQKSREDTLAAVVQKTGAVVIHPFDNYDVIAGQATVALEFAAEVPDLDFQVAPVGGGGLLSGTALSAKYFCPGTCVIGGEPEGADDAHRSMLSGVPETSQANSIADGLLTSLGKKTFPIILEHVQRVITVSDAEIISAMRLIWERMKIIVEPSCAVPLAAVLKQKGIFMGKRTGIILSGGNVDLDKISALFSK